MMNFWEEVKAGKRHGHMTLEGELQDDFRNKIMYISGLGYRVSNEF